MCGVALPAGLRESDRLPEPIFTPTTKAATGHDLPLTLEETRTWWAGLAERLRELTLGIYERIAEVALERGIIVADTKFEFGFADGELILIDEVGHAGLVAVLAGRRLRRGTRRSPLRQAVRARLAGRDRLGPRAAAAGAAGRRRREDRRQVPRGVRARDRRAVAGLSAHG